MCTSPITVSYSTDPVRNLPEFRRFGDVERFVEVPCGHCEECMRQRKNNLALRISMMARQCMGAHFVTFTYNDESLPVALSLLEPDYESGEYTRVATSILSLKSENNLRLQLLPALLSVHPFERQVRYSHYDDVTGSLWAVTPSVSRKDFRLWLKSARMHFFRKFGKYLKFSFITVPEYGSTNCISLSSSPKIRL